MICFIIISQSDINGISNLIICWGIDENISNYTQKTITLPLTFSSSMFPVIITDHSTAGIGNVHSGAGMVSKSEINISHSQAYSCYTCYIVIGY